MRDDKDTYTIFSFAGDAEVPHCCLRKPDVERHPHAQIGDLAITAWPLSTEIVAALATKYSTHVPADDVILHDFYDTTSDVIADSDILGKLENGGDYCELLFDMTLAHFAIDLTGDASTLTPTTEPPPGTFATVVYFFPSTCVGGAVMISHGHRTTTFEALDGCFLSFYSVCDVTVAPITSGHRSCLVYHAAYDLDDYDSDDCNASMLQYAPPLLPSIQELQDAARRFETLGARGTSIAFEAHSLTFDSLTGRDKAVVDLLLAADVFDIALVHVVGDNNSEKTHASPTLTVTFHPLCNTPALVQNACRATSLTDLAGLFLDELPACLLLLWPKANRVYMLGYDRTIALLRANSVGDVSNDLGYGSLRRLFQAAIHDFFLHHRTQLGAKCDTPQSTYPMASLLYDHGDVGLLVELLDAHDAWADDATMANWLLAVLRRFGAARFLHRLQATNVTSTFVAHLVHLATAGDTLAQTTLCDCLPLWWPRLLRDLTTNACAKKAELHRFYDVETYMLTYPMGVAASAYLGRHLADDLVCNVATYLVEPHVSLLDAIQESQRYNDCLTGYLPVVLWQRRAAPCNVRFASYMAVATEYWCLPGEPPRCLKGCVVYLALLTVGTPAFAAVDKEVQTCRDCDIFQQECAAIDKSTLSSMQALVLEEYMQRRP
ncbi:hypothetical protein SDRG_15389 [Saprolegnia diclina VS20]|uniref:Uncharacterized protein n=1 Tax=Saprolegnia diclina (strain VS20) TaxID=1156394 RepID=T0Q0A8_SAPDV|nr:hypothetical protein SDRG_15389 [Saprolegnia diclina VS20]EQC26800.1 hypothetical protein SDRG_15389 [Saprolegnia diclina VS20]|eukprot:XP_008619782.1 hypothetical protein SDRG_15389 [Saprolegnia diclina VS20]